MAIWQFEVSLVPHSDQESLFHVGFQQLRAKLDNMLPRCTSWSETIDMWGFENGDRVHLVVEAGRVVEIIVRLNLREPSHEFIEAVLSLASECECDLENDGHRFGASSTALLDVGKHSNPASGGGMKTSHFER